MGTSYQMREVLISCYQRELIDMEGTQDYDLALVDFRNSEDVVNKPWCENKGQLIDEGVLG